MATSHRNPNLNLIIVWMIQLFGSGVLADSVTSRQGCSVYHIGPGRPSPSVAFSDSLVISNLLLNLGDTIKLLQVHLYDDNDTHQAEVFVNDNDKLVINRIQPFETLSISRHALPPAPSALYWQHLVINHTSLNTMQAYNLDDKNNTLIAGYFNKTTKVVINSTKNITVAFHCINDLSALSNYPANETSQENILQWRESIAWLLLSLSLLCIIFLSVALCMRQRALTSIQSIVPSFTKFLKRTSSHHTREPSAELKVDVNMQIRREPEEVSDPSEIPTIGNYIEEIQPPSYTTQVTEVTSGPCESSSMGSLDHFRESKSSTPLSDTTNISQESQSSLHRSHVTEQSYVPFDSSYESQNMHSKHSQALSNGTQPNLSNGFNR